MPTERMQLKYIGNLCSHNKSVTIKLNSNMLSLFSLSLKTSLFSKIEHFKRDEEETRTPRQTNAGSGKRIRPHDEWS